MVIDQPTATSVRSSSERSYFKSNLELDAINVINKINYYSRGSCSLLFLKTSLLGIMELTSYLAAVGMIYCFFISRTTILNCIQNLEGATNISQDININETIDFLLIFKSMIFLTSALFVIIAILLRKIRMKNIALRKVKERVRDFLERHANA